MATRNIVPRADGEGKLGTTAKKWGEVHAGAVSAGSVTSTGAVKTTGITTRQNSTAYAVEDVAFSASIPGKLVLQCTTAGTTAASEPDMSGAAAGGTVTDGTVVWTYVKILSGDGTPLGTILPFPANGTNPSGYLDCDGSAVSRTMYPDLFALIGTTYGAGDGSTTFNLPDLSDGRFLEGSSTAGTAKAAGLPNITGTIGRNSGGSGAISPFYYLDKKSGAFDYTNGTFSQITAGAASTFAQEISFDASKSNAIYGAANTVQPKSLTVRYIIKAFDGQTANSALIDVTQYAQDLANKASRGLDNLTQAGEDHFLEQDFTIIYPNNGTAANPANVTVNTRYVELNPFSGYQVRAVAELKINDKWGEVQNVVYPSTSSNSYGVLASVFDGSIVVQTAKTALIGNSVYDGNPWGSITTITSAPCRVKIWKIGKVANS